MRRARAGMNMMKSEKNIDKKSNYGYNKRRVRVGDCHPPLSAKNPESDSRCIDILILCREGRFVKSIFVGQKCKEKEARDEEKRIFNVGFSPNYFS